MREIQTEMNWDLLKTKVEIVSGIVGMIAIIGGGGYALFEYWERADSDRAKESFTFVERFYKTPIIDAQLKLSTSWGKHEVELRKLSSAAGKGETAAVDAYTTFILTTVASEQLEPAIFTMIGFFEGIGLCTKHDWCDKKMAEAFFCDRAREFYQLHFRFIRHKREQWSNPKLAGETDEFVYKTCSAGT